MAQECTKLDKPPLYAEFLASYLLPNKPVIVGPSLIRTWPALRTWTTREGGINWDHLKDEYGAFEVTVADCSTRDSSDQCRSQMLFRDVVSLWQQGTGQTLYVKDWHLARALRCISSNPSASSSLSTEQSYSYDFYTTPDIFRDDWMNAYYSAQTEDDFRFVYVGAAGTFTPLHRDVYTSYSWSTNISGRKRWWLFPPEQTQLLFRKGGETHLEVAYDVRDVDSQNFPLFHEARPIVVEQGPGETIFVPSGWYHQVENLTACISINHNWCNSVNLPSLYDSMCAKVTEVEAALEDVKELLSQGPDADFPEVWQREWVNTVQDVVKMDAGWNWITFWRMIHHALSLAVNCPNTGNESLWITAPAELMPSIDFIKSRIQPCYSDFVERDGNEQQYVTGLHEVLVEIGALLDFIPDPNTIPQDARELGPVEKR